MTRLTGCDMRGSSVRLLSARLLAFTLIAMASVMVPMISLTSLRFRTRDMRIESSKLQQSRRALLTRKSDLVSEVEELKGYGRLRQYAEDVLGLVESAPDQSRQARVLAESIKRWDDAVSEMKDRQFTPPRGREFLLAAVGEQVMAWTSVSQAREPQASE